MKKRGLAPKFFAWPARLRKNMSRPGTRQTSDTGPNLCCAYSPN